MKSTYFTNVHYVSVYRMIYNVYSYVVTYVLSMKYEVTVAT